MLKTVRFQDRLFDKTLVGFHRIMNLSLIQLWEKKLYRLVLSFQEEGESAFMAHYRCCNLQAFKGESRTYAPSGKQPANCMPYYRMWAKLCCLPSCLIKRTQDCVCLHVYHAFSWSVKIFWQDKVVRLNIKVWAIISLSGFLSRFVCLFVLFFFCFTAVF